MNLTTIRAEGHEELETGSQSYCHNSSPSIRQSDSIAADVHPAHVMILRHRTLWDSIPEHPLPGTPFQNILYLGLRSRTRTVIKGHAVLLQFNKNRNAKLIFSSINFHEGNLSLAKDNLA